MTPQQREITEAFRSQEYIRDWFDVQPGHAWDSLKLAAGETFNSNLKLFELPMGAELPDGSRKTYADTSMNESHQFMNPERFAIRRVLFTFSKSALAIDVYAIAEQFVWSFWMGRKRYLGSPIISLQMAELPAAPIRICDYCRSVWCNNSTCPGCGARQFHLSTLAGEASGTCFVMDLGKNTLVIEQGIYFGITFEGEPHTVSAPLTLWCHFEGLHARGVQ